MSTRTIVLATAAFAFSMTVHAQWLNERTPGIPRTADGKPNLTAPAPRTTEGKPDFSGIWLASPHPAYMLNIASDLDAADVQPWATKLFVERMNNFGKDDPASIGCQPFGPRHIFGIGLPESARMRIVQTPALLATLQEDLTFRQIFMDGRKLPKNPNASFMGFSVARWEAEELVIESEGFKDTTWLDFGGHPHTEELHITERLRRVDFGHIQRRITLTDPKVFNKPITIASDLTLVPDTELLEYVCAETPPTTTWSAASRSASRRRSSRSTWASTIFSVPRARTLSIPHPHGSLIDGQLFADFNGKGHIPMVSMSNTTFSPRLLGTYEFFTDEHGEVTHVLAHAIGGSIKIVRRRNATPTR